MTLLISVNSKNKNKNILNFINLLENRLRVYIKTLY